MKKSSTASNSTAQFWFVSLLFVIFFHFFWAVSLLCLCLRGAHPSRSSQFMGGVQEAFRNRKLVLLSGSSSWCSDLHPKKYIWRKKKGVTEHGAIHKTQPTGNLGLRANSDGTYVIAKHLPRWSSLFFSSLFPRTKWAGIGTTPGNCIACALHVRLHQKNAFQWCNFYASPK